MSLNSPRGIAIAAGLMTIAALAFASPAAAKPGPEANRTAMMKVYEAFNTGDVSGLEKYVAADMMEHQNMPGMAPGLEGLKQVIGMMRVAFPDFQIKAEDMVVADDKVVARFTISGTQKGEWMGMPASGKSFSVGGVDIVRFENGKGVEHWGYEDDMTMMQQLGMMPANGGMAPGSEAPAPK